MNENDTKTVLKSIIKNNLYDWHPSEQTIDNIFSKMDPIMQTKFFKDIDETKKFIKIYLKECILKSYSPQSKGLRKIFFLKYKTYYDETNQFMNFEDNFLNERLFVTAVLQTLLFDTNLKVEYHREKFIKMHYQLNVKNALSRNSKKEENKKKILKLYETQFKGDPTILKEVMNCLSDKEKEILNNATYMNTQYVEVFRKINNAIKPYFMLTYLQYEPEEKQKIMIEAMDSQKNYLIIKKLQKEYASKINVSLPLLLSIINSNSAIDTKQLNVFLGLEIYNLEKDIETNTRKFILDSVKLTKKVIEQYNRKGLFQIFGEYKIEDIIYEVEQIKKTNTKSYNCLIEKHGKSLKEKKKIQVQNEGTYEYIINKMHSDLEKIIKDRKKKLKQELKNSKEYLSIIKERRRLETIANLSKKYNISIEKICEIFSENLLLFGDLIPDVIKEIEDYNYPIETKETYQYYEQFNLKR